jgi:hypothetical protein
MQRTRPLVTKTLITWCALLGYLVVVLGLPLPGVMPVASPSAVLAKRMAGKDHSVPFPCMDKPCGCVTAAQCFRDCCCHTPAETLAWARSHDVSPDVLRVLRQRVAVGERPAQACCAAAPTDPLEDLSEVCFEYEYLAAADDPDSVTSAPLGAAEPERQQGHDAQSPVSQRTVVLKSLLACGGLVSQWLAVGVCLLPADATPVACGPPPVEQVDSGDWFCCGQRAEPVTPPPRVV